jgi:branched-chain amino acid transport system permease protein
VEIIIYGAVNSMVFMLMAAGFALVYGVSRIPNFAHGAVYVLAGFLTWSFLNDFRLPYVLAVVLAIFISALLGLVIYRFVLMRLRGMPTSEIIGTFAVGLVILESLRLQGIAGFKGFIGPFYSLPPFFDAKIRIAGVFVDWQRFFILGLGGLILLAIYLFTHYSKMGLKLRGIAQDEQAAMMLGINADRTAMVSLALGSSLAAMSAVLIIPLGNLAVEQGYHVLIRALAVCIVGGLGSWAGTIIASLILGYIVIISNTLFGGVWESVVLVGTIILILLLKPSGLLGKQKELEERV